MPTGECVPTCRRSVVPEFSVTTDGGIAGPIVPRKLSTRRNIPEDFNLINIAVVKSNLTKMK